MLKRRSTKIRSLAILVLAIGWSLAASASTNVLFIPKFSGAWASGFPLANTGPANVAVVGSMVPKPSINLPAHAVDFTEMQTVILPQPTSFPFYSSQVTRSIDNAAGAFGQGMGPGNAIWCPGHFGAGMGGACPAATPSAGTRPGLIRYQGGGGYGGTARLLGGSNSHPRIISGAGFVTGTIFIPGDGLGGVPGSAATGVGVLQHTTQLWTSPQTVKMLGAPWTTGTVRVEDTFGAVSSMITTSGFDNRNAAGTMGTIRMVTPALAQYLTPAASDNFAGVFSLELQFIPEPGATLMLAVGLFALPVIYKLRTRR